MAFYNRKMAENKSLTKAWRAGQLRKLDGDKGINLPEICCEIARWMRRERHPRNRLSLRSFSALLSGAIRLYGHQVDHLLKDTFQCSLFKSAASRRLDVDEPIVEEKTLHDTVSQNNATLSEQTENDPEDADSSPTDDETMEDDEPMSSDESTVFTVSPNYEHEDSINEPEINETKRDQEIQTSPLPPTLADSLNLSQFNPNLPFAYILVHDNYHSIPSKILFSSLSENVKFLPIRKPMN